MSTERLSENAAACADSDTDAGSRGVTIGRVADDEVTRIAPVTPTRTPTRAPTRAPSRTPGYPTLPGETDDADVFASKRADNDDERTMPGAAQTLPGTSQSIAPSVRQVGRYLIQERLGRGGMATVFRAHDPGIGRDVAIKFLHASLCEDEEYRARFLREARAAGGFSHPNIVTVYDVGEIEGRPYIAMELLTGEPLSLVMQGNEPLPLRDVVAMGIQLARALDYAHQRGIVHRDIKPGNIVRMQGSDQIKVLDFGIARMESTANEQRTRVGDVLGTPQYMSPEQTQGETLDGRSDLFSTGIVLYQMLTGQRPFQGDSLVALAMKIVKDDPPPIDKVRTDMPPALRRVVERCLAKSPERRFQSGRELADALTRVLSEIDEAAREKDRPRIVPLRVKWAAAMALVVAVVMALAATLITQRQYAAMMDQVTDYGASMARFIAAQNALPALSEDWPVVDVAVQQIMRTGDVQDIVVTDRAGIVRAAGDTAQEGQRYVPGLAESLGKRDGGVVMSRSVRKGESTLGFEAPITFQGKPVGRVMLSLPERPLIRVARLSLALMAALVIVTVLAVAIAMYFAADWFSRPIKLIGEAMDEVAHGHFDHRIAETRNDEFGLLYASFDRMAEALNAGRESREPTTRAATGDGATA